MALTGAAKMFLTGTYRIVANGIILGIVSLIFYACDKIAAFYRRETVAGVIVTVLLLLLSFGWAFTFVRERSRYVTQQHVSDSLSYELSKFTQAYDENESIIFGEDTIVITNRYRK